MSAPELGSCLYFGTFNPIHAGHLMIAQSVLNQFGEALELQSVTFIPAGIPPHRNQSLASPIDRLNMVKLATQDDAAFQVCELETHKATPCYTIETIQFLISEKGFKKPIPMIIGSDALLNLVSWRQPEVLIEQVCFLQMSRPGTSFVNSITLGGQNVVLNTHAITMPTFAISSSWVRSEIYKHQNAQSLRYFVPESVCGYIDEQGLYRE